MRRLKYKDVEALLILKNSDGWKLVTESLEEKQEALMRSLLEPVTSIDSAISRAYYLGMVAAYRDMAGLPDILINMGDKLKEEEDG